jgi:predicted nucleic acid-binding protein
MNGTSEDTESARVYIDTNIFILANEKQDGLAKTVIAFLLDEVERGRQRLVTSELTFSELLVKPLEHKRSDLVRLYDNWTISNPGLLVAPITRDILGKAAQLRAAHKQLKLPDAIHVATAVQHDCQYLLTNDRRLAGQFGMEILIASESSVAVLVSAGSR